jgi:hypothetical protein
MYVFVHCFEGVYIDDSGSGGVSIVTCMDTYIIQPVNVTFDKQPIYSYNSGFSTVVFK